MILVKWQFGRIVQIWHPLPDRTHYDNLKVGHRRLHIWKKYSFGYPVCKFQEENLDKRKNLPKLTNTCILYEISVRNSVFRYFHATSSNFSIYGGLQKLKSKHVSNKYSKIVKKFKRSIFNISYTDSFVLKQQVYDWQVNMEHQF